jgi:branched-chain amino acid transport system permease protein
MIRLLSTVLIGVSSGAIYALMALALVLVWRSTRVVNFAQAGQAVLSTYVGYEVIVHVQKFWLALPLAIVVGAIIGAAVDVVLIRKLSKSSGPASEIRPVIATLGLLGLITSTVGLMWGGDLKRIPAPIGTHGYTFGHTTIPFSPYNLLIVGTAAIVMAIFALIFQRTNLGLALRASAFAPETARLAGVRVDRTRTIGWAFAGAAGAVAGVMVTPQSALAPNSMDLLLVLGFVAAVIGGLDSLIGASIGGLILGIGLAVILEYVSSSLAFPAAFIVLILVLLVRPQGILGKLRSRDA